MATNKNNTTNNDELKLTETELNKSQKELSNKLHNQTESEHNENITEEKRWEDRTTKEIEVSITEHIQITNEDEDEDIQCGQPSKTTTNNLIHTEREKIKAEK